MPGLAERFDLPKIDRTPRPLAEYLDQNIALAAMRKFERKSSPSGWLRSAWHNAEYGLNTDSTESDEYFLTSQHLISQILNDPSAAQDTVLGALSLSTYIPMFKKRAQYEAINDSDCEDVYSSLGRMINYLRPLEIDEPPQWRMVEIGVLALSARSRQPQLLLFPSSPREEMSTIQTLNHDYYYIDNGNKIPLQQKLIQMDKVYDEWIKVLTLEPMVNKALKVSGRDPEAMELRDKMNHLLSLIAAETNGLKLNKDELKFLNFLTEAVAAHRQVNRVERYSDQEVA